MLQKSSFWIVIALWALSLVSAIVFLSSGERTRANQPFSLTKRIAVIEIFDVITYEGESGGFAPIATSGALNWIEEIESAARDPFTAAIVIRINSPGGTVGATQELHAAIRRARENGKIVIASFGEIAASGGYYIAAAADAIVSLPGTLTGSIGVIMHGFQYDELMRKIGIRANVIKSGENKDLMAGHRPMTPEEQQILTSLVSNTYEQFLFAVMQGRNFSRERLLPLADGRIFTGEQALQVGLVDKIGTFDDAVALAIEKANLPKGTPIYYPSEENLRWNRILRRISAWQPFSLPSAITDMPYTKLWYYTTF